MVLFEFLKLQFLVFTNDQETESRHARIRTALANVTNKGKCAEMLMKECQPRFSPYDYEELTFFYQQLSQLDNHLLDCKKPLLVLEIINGYACTNQPEVVQDQVSDVSDIYQNAYRSVKYY